MEYKAVIIDGRQINGKAIVTQDKKAYIDAVSFAYLLGLKMSQDKIKLSLIKVNQKLGWAIAKLQ